MATTTENMEKMGRTAEVIARTAQQNAYTAMDYTARAQEVNTELLRKTTEAWIEGFRKQAELSQDMSEAFFKRAEDQANAYQGLFGQWGLPFMGFPYVRMPYDPFEFWGDWTRAARGTQQTAARETARVIQTTAPATNGSLPIAGYDEKGIREIGARLDTLTVEQLERLRDYERLNKNRETLIKEIDRKIRAAS